MAAAETCPFDSSNYLLPGAHMNVDSDEWKRAEANSAEGFLATVARHAEANNRRPWTITRLVVTILFWLTVIAVPVAFIKMSAR
jgi:hypothetical protein